MPVHALFKPFQLGTFQLPTRVVMAPMTRSFRRVACRTAK
jgi:2,4-dienoyl-CoA reductase-like NADH-dependent reductase (Old Yellow Enzyme family)